MEVAKRESSFLEKCHSRRCRPESDGGERGEEGCDLMPDGSRVEMHAVLYSGLVYMQIVL